jgi:hypothetical protein
LRCPENLEVERVIEIVAVVGDLIAEVRDLGLERRAPILFASRLEHVKLVVLSQALTDFERQVQPGKQRICGLEQLDHALALFVVVEPAVVAHAFGQHFLAGMTEGRMSEIVGQGDRFGEILVSARARASCG